MELYDRKPRVRDHLRYSVQIRVHKNAHRDDKGRQPFDNRARLFGFDVSRAPRVEIEPQGIGARFDGRPRIVQIRDAADLHSHHGLSPSSPAAIG
jgi:hypothetical protein